MRRARDRREWRYPAAPLLATLGIDDVSDDEMTGSQAWEWVCAGRPPAV